MSEGYFLESDVDEARDFIDAEVRAEEANPMSPPRPGTDECWVAPQKETDMQEHLPTEYAPPSTDNSLQIVGSEQVDLMIANATAIADRLAKIIKDQKLFNRLGTRDHVRVEGWTTLAALMGVIPKEREDLSNRLDDGSYEAYVELIRADGSVMTGASARCGADESTWGNRDEYARKSMAITRATGKACRIAFAWVMALTGYDTTPAEEMDAVNAAEIDKLNKRIKDLEAYSKELSGLVANGYGEWVSRTIDEGDLELFLQAWDGVQPKLTKRHAKLVDDAIDAKRREFQEG